MSAPAKRTRAEQKQFDRLVLERTAELRKERDEEFPVPPNDTHGIFRTLLNGIDSFWNIASRNNF